MKRLFSVGLLALLVVFLVAPGAAKASGGVTELCRATMWAGQHTDVGKVVVGKDARYLYVAYQTSGDWKMATVHLHVAARMEDVPQKRGNPIPGKFAYKADVDGFTKVFRIPLRKLPRSRCLVIAAHAEVRDGQGDCAGAASIVLPAGLVHVCVTRPDDYDWLNGPYLYHEITGAGALDGVYEAWCVDVDGDVSLACFDATMVSSLGPQAQTAITAPENWDLINYVLNRIPEYRATLGAYMIDIQNVFWELADPGSPTGREAPLQPAVVQAILDDARANGEGYVPGPGELLAVAIVHADDAVQETIIGIPVPPCQPGGEETAWAGRLDFPGKNWALYFECCGL